jgi:hypothetical protein
MDHIAFCGNAQRFESLLDSVFLSVVHARYTELVLEVGSDVLALLFDYDFLSAGGFLVLIELFIIVLLQIILDLLLYLFLLGKNRFVLFQGFLLLGGGYGHVGRVSRKRRLINILKFFVSIHGADVMKRIENCLEVDILSLLHDCVFSLFGLQLGHGFVCVMD